MARFSAVFYLQEGGGYTVLCPEVPGCITQGDTYEEALDMIKDAIAGMLEGDEARRDLAESLAVPNIIFTEVEVRVPDFQKTKQGGIKTMENEEFQRLVLENFKEIKDTLKVHEQQLSDLKTRGIQHLEEFDKKLETIKIGQRNVEKGLLKVEVITANNWEDVVKLKAVWLA